MSEKENKNKILVITSFHDLNGNELGIGLNKPLLRKKLILKALEDSNKVSVINVQEPEKDLSFAQNVHDQGFLNFLNTAFTRWMEHVNNNTHDSFFGGSSDRSGGDTNYFVPAQVAPRDGTHRPGNSLFGQSCYYSLDRLTPIKADTAPSLRFDLAVVRKTIHYLSEHYTSSSNNKDNNNHSKVPVIYTLTTQPGHHSGVDFFGGYCFINNAAVIARGLEKNLGKKIAILDIDYHAGNGTTSIFYNDPQIFVASIHADPNFDYPYNSGFADQKGGPLALNTKLMIPLPQSTNWEKYEVALKESINSIKQFEPAVIVISLGADTLRGDPEASPLGGFLLDDKDFESMGLLLASLKIPLVFVQEGGYYLDKVPDAVKALILAAAN